MTNPAPHYIWVPVNADGGMWLAKAHPNRSIVQWEIDEHVGAIPSRKGYWIAKRCVVTVLDEQPEPRPK